MQADLYCSQKVWGVMRSVEFRFTKFTIVRTPPNTTLPGPAGAGSGVVVGTDGGAGSGDVEGRAADRRQTPHPPRVIALVRTAHQSIAQSQGDHQFRPAGQQREVGREPNIVSFGWDLAELDERELRPSSEEEKRRNGEQRNGGTACVTAGGGGLGRDEGRITPANRLKSVCRCSSSPWPCPPCLYRRLE